MSITIVYDQSETYAWSYPPPNPKSMAKQDTIRRIFDCLEAYEESGHDPDMIKAILIN